MLFLLCCSFAFVRLLFFDVFVLDVLVALFVGLLAVFAASFFVNKRFVRYVVCCLVCVVSCVTLSCLFVVLLAVLAGFCFINAMFAMSCVVWCALSVVLLFRACLFCRRLCFVIVCLFLCLCVLCCLCSV